MLISWSCSNSSAPLEYGDQRWKNRNLHFEDVFIFLSFKNQQIFFKVENVNY